jgi:hypothetical protein
MKKTFTTMNFDNGKFIATVFDAVSNQEIYKTSPCLTQLQATQQVNNFLTSGNTNTSAPRTVITNTTTFKNIPPTGPVTPRRCCGR